MSKGEATKSSHESWNAIIEKISTRAEEIVNKKGVELGNVKLDTAADFTNVINLKRNLGESFKEALNDPQFTKNLDPKTVELFKQNDGKVIDHILDTTKSPIDANKQRDAALLTSNLADNIKSFKAEAEVTLPDKDKNLSWKKVAAFCKSVKLGKLAEYCHDKHVEGLAKEISKGLKLSKDSSLKYSKPSSTKHKNESLGR